MRDRLLDELRGYLESEGTEDLQDLEEEDVDADAERDELLRTVKHKLGIKPEGEE